MKIEHALLKDIPLIQELARKSWESAYKEILGQAQIEYMLSTMYSTQELQNQIEENPNYHYVLIWNKNTVGGFMGFEHHYEEQTTKLHRLYLLPEAQGKGLGKASLNFLKKEAKMNKDTRIILNVNKNNNARNIYESQGFTIYDEGVFDIGNGYVMDDFLMEFFLLKK